jgi:hypothetical protein
MNDQLHLIPTPKRSGSHPLRGAYLEACWTSVIGPSGVLLLRFVAGMTANGPVQLHPGDLAAVLGIGNTGGKNSRLEKTLDRLDRFGLLDRRGNQIHVPDRVHPLPAAALERSCDLVHTWHRQLDRPTRAA